MYLSPKACDNCRKKSYIPLDFSGKNSYYLSVGSNSLSFGFGLRQARCLLRSQNIFSVTKEEFKNQHSRTESTLSYGFTDRQSMWHNRLDTVSGECQDLWTGRSRNVVLQPWRTKESPPHSDSNSICIRNGIWIKDPNYYEKHGEIAGNQILQTRIAPSPIWSQSSNVRNHRYGCGRKYG